jgi:cytochrome bd-type quinol oxidase subunit 2
MPRMEPVLLLGIVGMALILLGFLLNQSGKWKSDTLSYDACNALGSLFLAIYAYAGSAWPFLVLNSVWLAYSLRDVLRDLNR